MLGVYIHIPFCQRKCNYCAFSSFVCDEKEVERYTQKLIEDINSFHNKYPQDRYKKVDTIFIGGGTPSLLPLNHFEKIVKALKDNFDVSDDYEFTIECNPNSLSEEKLSCYKKNGANRLSIGVQSLDDDELKFAGRIHDGEGAIKTIEMAKNYFDNISCDLLIGLKGMKKSKFLNGLDRLISLGVKHISAYMLQIEKGTVLEKMLKEGTESVPDEEECIEVYEETTKFLAEKGFSRYEVSNFAKEGYESRHNLKYWSGEEYVGFGLSAHGFLGDQRIACADRFDLYYKDEGMYCENLGNKEKIEEHIMLGLRCKIGVDKKYLMQLGYDIDKNNSLKDFIENGVIISGNDSKLFLNPQFYGVNNFIITSLLPD